jgi:hypothetical protein
MTMKESLLRAWPRDFGQIWYAAGALLRGTDPYALIGPGEAFDWGWPFAYPLTSAIVGVPFTPFTEPMASALFVVVGASCFAWTLMEYGYGPLFGFFSFAMRDAAGAAQWSPLIASSVVLGAPAFILAAKPTIGAAMFFARPRWYPILGGIVLLAVCFAVQPSWVGDWRDALHRYAIQVAPVTPFHSAVSYPGGALALLCLLRWRRPEARLVAALACVPLTVSHYETVPLLLVPRTFVQAAFLVALGYVHFLFMSWLLPVPWTADEFVGIAGRLFVVTAYLPVTLMVLRRPNEGAIPQWIERRVAVLPAWLRGAP